MRRRPRTIPKHAKRVFHGAVFDVYQWRQRMFDGSTQTFERARRADSVTIVPVTKRGTILLSRERQPGKPPFVGVPGGIVDGNETPREAARRELLEETGYSAARLIPWFSYQAGSRIDWTIHLFVARGCEKVRPQHLDAGEHITVREVTFPAFLRTLTTSRQARNQELVLLALKAHADKRELRRLYRTIIGS